MKKWIAGLLMVPCIAHAEFLTGNDIYQRMTSRDISDQLYALGYVVGAYDMGVHVFFCPRTEQNITAGQVRDIAQSYLASNPGQRHRTAEALMREAFRQVWPCANQNRNTL